MKTRPVLFARFGRLAIVPVLIGGLLAQPATSSAQTAPPPPINSPFVSISNAPQVTAQDIAKFDQVWMSPAAMQGRLDRDQTGMHNRQGWVAWGLAEEAPTMVRMYTLTHDPKYVEYLRQLAIIVLRNRDDHYAGFGDPTVCLDCTGPFPDKTRGGTVQAAWGVGSYGEYVQGGGLHPVDEVISGVYNYTLAAFARLVAENPGLQGTLDPTTQRLDPNGHTYSDEAVAAANAALQTWQVFLPQWFDHVNGGFEEGTFNRSAVVPSPMVDCLGARSTAIAAAHRWITDPTGLTATLNDIDAGARTCQDAINFKGTPLAHNESGSLMMSFIELWRALDSAQYQNSPNRSPNALNAHNFIPLQATRNQRYFVDRLQVKLDSAQGERFWWHYNDDVVRVHAEDTNHGSLDMRYLWVLGDALDRLNAIVSPINETIPLNDGVLRRFADTFLEEMARPSEIDAGGDIRGDVDGRSASDLGKPATYYDPLCDGWVDLASVDATVFRMCRDVTTRIIDGAQPNLTITNHSDLLLNKQFARALSDINLTFSVGAAPASSDPTAWVFSGGTVQDVAYRGTDGKAYEAYRTLTGSGFTNLSGLAGAAGPAGVVNGYDFPSLGTHNVVYRGSDGHAHGLYWTCCAPKDDDLTRLTGLPGPVGNLLAYASAPFGVQNVIYRASGGHLYEMYWNTGAVGHDELTALPGVPLAGGDPIGYFVDAQTMQHVFYRASAGNLEHLSWGCCNVAAENLTARVSMFGIPSPAGDPTAYRTPSGLNTVVFRGVDGKLYLVGIGDGISFPITFRLSDLVPGAPLPAGDPHAYFDPNDGADHIVYRTSNGHIHELVLANGKVRHADLTTAIGAPASAGKPFGYVFPGDNTEHVLFRSATDGNVHDLTWNDPTSMIFIG